MHDLPVALESRYGAAIAIMRYMHWNWQELNAAPADLVEEIALRMAQENHWTAARRRLDAEMTQ